MRVVTHPGLGLVQERSRMDKKEKQEVKRKKKEEGNRMKEIRGWSSMVAVCVCVCVCVLTCLPVGSSVCQ